MAVLESLLHHTMGLSELSHVLYPAALESYEGVCIGQRARVATRQLRRRGDRPADPSDSDSHPSSQ